MPPYNASKPKKERGKKMVEPEPINRPSSNGAAQQQLGLKKIQKQDSVGPLFMTVQQKSVVFVGSILIASSKRLVRVLVRVS
jgi:hypothetical protein